VLVDYDTCLGRESCDMCLKACPYDAPQFGTGQNAKMQKCNCCIDRLAEGKKPVCVDACPMRALDAGPIELLKRDYGDCRDAEGFTYITDLEPSIIFKPKTVPASVSR